MVALHLLEIAGMFAYTFAVLMQPRRLRPFLSCLVLAVILWYNDRYDEHHFNFGLGIGFVVNGKTSIERWMIDLACQMIGALLAFAAVAQIKTKHHD